MYSGDVGVIDSETNMFFIIGCIKEFIIIVGGENIVLVFVEDVIKGYFLVIFNVMMVGDKRKYNIMFVILR